LSVDIVVLLIVELQDCGEWELVLFVAVIQVVLFGDKLLEMRLGDVLVGNKLRATTGNRPGGGFLVGDQQGLFLGTILLGEDCFGILLTILEQ
jgi:hypothetical protein